MRPYPLDYTKQQSVNEVRRISYFDWQSNNRNHEYYWSHYSQMSVFVREGIVEAGGGGPPLSGAAVKAFVFFMLH